MSVLSWAGNLMTWVTTPTVMPWAGVVAAFVAALSIDSKSWRGSPRKGLDRAGRVAAVWLLAAWVLCAARNNAGFGYGQGGAGLGSGGQGSGSGNGKAEHSGQRNGPAPSSITKLAGQFPGGTPPNVVVVISFVPSPVNAAVAQDFACDLLQKGSEAGATNAAIRATQMEDFDKLLIAELRAVSLPAALERPIVLIRRSPFPGENVVRRIQEKIRAVLPAATVAFDE